MAERLNSAEWGSIGACGPNFQLFLKVAQLTSGLGVGMYPAVPYYTAIYRDGHIYDFRFFRKRDRALSGPVGIIYRAVRGDRGCVGFFVD
jgi:hypothetical protein